MRAALTRAALLASLLACALPPPALAGGGSRLESAAASGSEEALVALASRLELGIGVPADPPRAMALFCRAALLGDRGALLHIADWLLVDGAPDYDPELAARWLHRLQRAERGAPLGAEAPPCPSPAATGLPAMAVALRLLIEHLAPEYGLDPNLVKAVVAVESSYRVDAVSDAGAAGLMQLMPESASRLAVTDRMDAEENLRGGMRDLATLIARYHGDLSLALAAYNAGEGAVDGCQCVPPIPETIAYVERVMTLYRQARDRAARALVEGTMG
ncbi:MAG TPA: transglycosylase SLT domain-containing protein [Acetobacteraceae bacterium]|nr:transglycosylase SLT domain-containing protein [Acetobacteraceae bacterium]